jgi:hypothetical protein
LHCIHVIGAGHDFYYDPKGSYEGFPCGNIFTLFENFNTIQELPTDPSRLVNFVIGGPDWSCTINHWAPSWEDPDKWTTNLVRYLTRPSATVREFLLSSRFLNITRRSPYIAVHIRQTDKVVGDKAEAKPVALSRYLDLCILARRQTGINRLVLCTDQRSVVNDFSLLALDADFDIVIDTEEQRAIGASDAIFKVGVQPYDWLDAFKLVVIMTESAYLVGSRDSYFFHVPLALRGFTNVLTTDNSTTSPFGPCSGFIERPSRA